jgi:hypothetical protein
MIRKTSRRLTALLLVWVMTFGCVTLPVTAVEAEAGPAANSSVLFHDDFGSKDFTQTYWKEVPAQWDVKVLDGSSVFQAVSTSSRTFLQNSEGSPWTDYEMSFKAKFTSNTAGRAEFFVRSDGNGNFYSVEANIATAGSGTVVFKIHRWANLVYQGNLTANVNYTYDATVWHDYKVEVKGSTIRLLIDNQSIISATDTANTLSTGYIGFRSQNIGLQVDEVTVTGEGGIQEPPKQFDLIHTPITQASATEGAVVSADIPGPSTVSARVYYRYGYGENGSVYEGVDMRKGTGDQFSAQIPAPSASGQTTLNYMIEAEDGSGNRKMNGYKDSFTNAAYTAAYWTQTPEQWTVTSDQGIPVMKALSGTRNYMTGTGSNTWKDYDVEFSAKFTAKADGKGEFFFRADEAGNFYAIEVQSFASGSQPLIKLHYWESTVYKSNLTANVNASFDPIQWNSYRIKVRGNQFTLFVNGTEVISATDANNRFPTGGIGYRSSNVGMEIAGLTVTHPVQLTGFQQLVITHSPKSEVAYNADIPVVFQVTDTGSLVTATVSYKHGDSAAKQVVLTQDTLKNFNMAIPGTNRYDKMTYHIAITDGENRTARYPASGELTVQVGKFVPYVTDFESMADGSVPSGWSVRGDAKVVQLPEGNKVLRLYGQPGTVYPSVTLSAPEYANLDNFSLKFRAKYVRTSDEYYNVWRVRYRAENDNNNYSMEWGTHNWRYFIMRKTDLGGNYALGTYNESLDNRWVDYEIRVNGITHELYINGNKMIGVDDFDTLRIEKGYIEFGVVNGINLMIDSLEVTPLEAAHVYYIEPSGNYTGLYGPGEQPGLKVYLAGGAVPHEYEVRYSVRKADGDKAMVSQGSAKYPVGANEVFDGTLVFDPVVNRIGTYNVKAELYIDGTLSESAAKTMRMAVLRETAAKSVPDVLMESKFGINTHYALNWRDDLMDAVNKAGIKHHRSHLNLADVFTGQYDSQGKPVFNFTKEDTYLDKVDDFGLNSIPVLGFIEDTTQAASYEGLKLIEDFAAASSEHYKDRLNQYETPNEPENYVKPYIPYEIVQQWKRAYIGVREGDPDATFIAGGHTSSVRSVLPPELELGAYNYADAFSWHPYVYNAMPDGAIESFIHDIGDMVDSYGGWKDFYLTEGGWPTAKGGHPSVTEEVQRDYIVRAFLIYMAQPQVRAWEYYNFKNDGTDENYYEIFWGMTDVDGRPKLSYGAVNNLMTTLEGAEYTGRISTPDSKVRAYVYLKDGKPIIGAWRSVDHKDQPDQVPPESELQLSVGSGHVIVRDINGNDTAVSPVNGFASVTVSGSPVYILNADPEILYASARTLLQDYRSEAAARIGKLSTPENGQAVNTLTGQLAAIDSRLESALQASSASIKATGLEQGIKDIYSLMKDMTAGIKDGRWEQAKAFAAMESFYNYAEAASKPLTQAKVQEGGTQQTYSYDTNLQQARSAHSLGTAGHNLLPVSTSALLRANRYASIAEARAERSKQAESAVYGLLAGEFAKVVEQMALIEEPVYVGAWLNVTPIRLSGEAGYTVRITGTAANEAETDQTLTLRFELPEGWGSVEAMTAVVKPGEPYRFDLPVLVPPQASKGQYAPKVILERNGTEVDSAVIDLRIDDAIEAKLMPVSATVSELQEIEVQLKGTSAYPKTGKVVLRGPDGQPLQPKSGDTFTNLAKGQTTSVRFLWDYRTELDFNSYVNDLTVWDTVNNIAIYQDRTPLDFLLMPKASQKPDIDGNLDDWKAAYPIHLRGAGRNNTGIYKPDNLDATAYAMWDEENFYAAVEVTDDIHKASENPPNMWKNDSVQLGFDPLSDSSASYNQDDMEWGFALHNDGTHLANIFYSRPPNLNGSVGSLLPYSIRRDEENRKTYYEIQIPKSMMYHLNLQEGGQFRFNVAVNDADMQTGRDNFIQWTKGIADSKNPGNFDSFTQSEGKIMPDSETDQQFVLETDRSIVEVKEEVTVTVSVDHADDLYGADLKLAYDTGRFQFVKAELAEPLLTDGAPGFLMTDDQDGVLRVIASRTGSEHGVNGRSELLRLTFKALTRDGLTEWTVGSGAVLSDSGGVNATVTKSAVRDIAVADSVAITGKEPRSEALVLIGMSFGKPNGAPGYDSKLDLNKDGLIDIIDLSYVALRILRSANPQE